MFGHVPILAQRVFDRTCMILIDSSIMHKIQFVTVLGRQVLLTETVSLICRFFIVP